MADTKISALPGAATLDGTEEIPGVQSAANVKMTAAQIQTYVESSRSFIYQNADRTLTNDVSLQKIFNQSANGALTLETGLYQITMHLWVADMSATSGNAIINILGAGTAVLAGQLGQFMGIDQTTLAAAAGLSGSALLGSNASSTNVVTAATSTHMRVSLFGVFKVTTAGTLIPSIQLNTAAAATVKAGSTVIVEKIAANAVYTSANAS